MRRMMLAQRLGRVADLALPGQEDEDVAGTDTRQLIDRIDDGIHQVALFPSACGRRIWQCTGSSSARPARFAARLGPGFHIRLDRSVTHLDRIHAPGNFDHRGRLAIAFEMLGETLRIDGGRCDDEFQVRAFR